MHTQYNMSRAYLAVVLLDVVPSTQLYKLVYQEKVRRKQIDVQSSWAESVKSDIGPAKATTSIHLEHVIAGSSPLAQPYPCHFSERSRTIVGQSNDT